MVERGPSRIGLVIMAVIYWGALFYWLRGALLDGGDVGDRPAGGFDRAADAVIGAAPVPEATARAAGRVVDARDATGADRDEREQQFNKQ